MARLVDLLQQIVQGAAGGQPGGLGSGAFFEKGQVAKVYEDGRLAVTVMGRTVDAKPVTDEVFRDGDLVWISQAGSEFIVHGGVR